MMLLCLLADIDVHSPVLDFTARFVKVKHSGWETCQ